MILLKMSMIVHNSNCTEKSYASSSTIACRHMRPLPGPGWSVCVRQSKSNSIDKIMSEVVKSLQ